MDVEKNRPLVCDRIMMEERSIATVSTPPPVTGDYEIDRQRHVRAFQERLPGEVEKMTWPLERMHALRDERLRALIRTAKERSPWHARRLRHISPDTLSGDDLSAIPTMNKADLMTHWDEIVTDQRLTLALAKRHLAQIAERGPAYLLDQYHVVTSSGSSGLNGVFAWDFEGWLDVELAVARRNAWLARHFSPGGGVGRVASVVSPSGIHMSQAQFRTFDTGSGSYHSFPVTLPLSEIVAGLNAYQPDWLGGYPSSLLPLAREARAGRLRIAPWMLLCGGEPLSLEVRKMIEAAFGVGIVNTYAASEISIVAESYPGTPELHLVEDVAIYEPVDKANQPVPSGVPAARLLLTNVVNQVLPLIRYEINDQITFLNTPNPDPWTGRLVSPPLGRIEDEFVYSDGVEVNPTVFAKALDRLPGIYEYQVRQTKRGAAIAMRIEGNVDLDPARQELLTALRRLGLVDPEVSLTTVDQLDRLANSGKLKRFVALPKTV